VAVLTDQTITDITIRVDRSVNDVLELAKAQGHSKKDLLQRAVRWIQFVDNDYDLKTTESMQNDVLQLKALERVREEQVAKGATSSELVAFDEVIKNAKNRLKLYREHDGDGEVP
jgi:hypothetical protein